jgi:hypothetical protein
MEEHVTIIGFRPQMQSITQCLAHPTAAELAAVWTNNATAWKDALTIPQYLEESLLLTTVPLAKDGGMTNWILVDDYANPGQRWAYASCETFRKRALASDGNGNVTEGIVHGIASVFCPEKFRGHGYPKTMMRELANKLSTWQADDRPCFGSILYSDIGKNYYSELGWHPNKTNSHVELLPSSKPKSPLAQDVRVADLPDLCARDEALMRTRLSVPSKGPNATTRISIIPDLDHFGWHHAKEEIACKRLFRKVPQVKGALAGTPGHQIWAIWTHRYYNHPYSESHHNVLYILRFVMEADEKVTRLSSDADKAPNEEIYNEQCRYLKAVLEAAQAEAAAWKLDVVQLWDPTPLVRHVLADIGMTHKIVERQEESLASGMWYDEQGGISDLAPLWLNNEHYAWC